MPYKKRKLEAEKERLKALKYAMKDRKVREKISKAQAGSKNSFFGKHHSGESKDKIGKASTSRKTWEKWGLKTRFKKGHKPLYSPKGVKRSRATRDKISQNKIEFYSKHPERHANFIMAQKGFVSKPQMFLYRQISKLFCFAYVCLEHPVKTSKAIRYIDVAVPIFRLGFEYDSKHWHKNSNIADLERDKELKDVGWNIIHIKER